MFVLEARGAGSAMSARRRGITLAVLTGIALVLHAGFLGGLEWRIGVGGAVPPLPAAVSVRVLEPVTQPEPAPALIEPAAAQPPPPVARPAPRPKRLTEAAARAEPPAPVASAEPAPAPAPAPAQPEPAQAAVAASPAPEPPAAIAQPAEAAPAASDANQELPVYATLIPPPITLRYLMRRGRLSGTGELQWRPDGDRYEARFEGRMAGIAVLRQTSQGGFDEAGIAPLRFTDERIRGGVRAANFQREAGKITFSGPSVEYPLWAGSQDRLSWMIQLAAVLEAEPPRLQDSGKVVMHVIGARGDARLWVFRFVELEAIETGAGVVQAAKFVREAADPYDTRVEVWLDPRRHHLPARAVLRAGPDDDGLELLLQESLSAPHAASQPAR